MKKSLFFLTAILFCSQIHIAAMAETAEEEKRIESLEQKLKEVETELQKIKDNSLKGKDTFENSKATPAFLLWKDDFILSTADEKFWMKIRGNVHFDSKFYGGNSNDPTEFDIRRVRMDFQGMWYHYIYFRVQAEFADSPYIRNAWVDFMLREWLHFRLGQMKPPFSTSWWTLDNRVNFLERGASTPVYPYFDRGLWLWGDVLDKTLTWNLSAFTGAGIEKDDQYGDIDDHKDYVGRIFYSPFKNGEEPFLNGLHLCIQGTTGRQSVPTNRFEQKGFSTPIRDDKYWTWETESPGYGKIGSRDRWGAELHYILGPFSMSSEYLEVLYDNIEVFAPNGVRVINEDGKIRSWSSWVSYFITGEKKEVSNFGWKQPKPNTDFDPLHFQGTGAWEILGRYTSTKTSESLFDTYVYGGNTYSILEGASRVDEYTVGLSWTWNALVRWQLNYTHLDGNDIETGSGSWKGKKSVDNEDMVGVRMIFKF